MGHEVWLVLTAFLAAVVNGALGFGFSSLTVPVGLLFLPLRALSPTLVLLEVPLNLLSLLLNRGAVKSSLRHTRALALGLLPGLLWGSALLAGTSALWLKAGTYAVLLPLVLLQLLGARWRLASERWAIGLPAGFGVGVLYATTTISGPPLSMLLGAQALDPQEFRASMAVLRVLESGCTLVLFAVAGLFDRANVTLFLWLLPAVALGAPVGRLAVRAFQPESFRRAWLLVTTVLVVSGLALAVRESL
jgi:hypothetical protein